MRLWRIGVRPLLPHYWHAPPRYLLRTIHTFDWDRLCHVELFAGG